MSDERNGKGLRDVLLDPCDKDVLVLVNEHGVRVAFKQIFSVMIKRTLYCIMSPIALVEGLDEDSALVFQLHRDQTLKAVADRDVSDHVFERYYNAIKKERKECGT